jgi:hypothetical protein
MGDLDQRIGRDDWCFAPTRDFGTSRLSATVLPPSRNLTLISLTLNVTHYDVYNSRPAERGLSLETLERDTGRKFQRYQVVDASSPVNRYGTGIRGQTIEVYRPPATVATSRPARPSPGAQPAPPPAVIQRLDTDQKQFDQRMQKERAALQREHQNELKRGRPGVAADQVRQQQQAELQAQQDREAKERNEEAIRQWQSEEFPRIARAAHVNKATLASASSGHAVWIASCRAASPLASKVCRRFC